MTIPQGIAQWASVLVDRYDLSLGDGGPPDPAHECLRRLLALYDEADRLLTGAVFSGLLDNATPGELRTFADRRKERDADRLPNIHPADCQSCSEGDKPCRTHAEDWRYWRACTLDMEAALNDLMRVVATLQTGRET